MGDDAFPLKPYLMKPFAGRCTAGMMPREERIFNYMYCTFKVKYGNHYDSLEYLGLNFVTFNRLSRSRRVIENAFGILAGHWRLFRKPIIAKPENIEHYTRACIVMQNYLI